MLQSVMNQMYNMQVGNRLFNVKLVAMSELWAERWVDWSIDDAKDWPRGRLTKTSKHKQFFEYLQTSARRMSCGLCANRVLNIDCRPVVPSHLSLSTQEWLDDPKPKVYGVGFEPIACRYGQSFVSTGPVAAYDGWLQVYKSLSNYIAALGRINSRQSQYRCS